MPCSTLDPNKSNMPFVNIKNISGNKTLSNNYGTTFEKSLKISGAHPYGFGVLLSNKINPTIQTVTKPVGINAFLIKQKCKRIYIRTKLFVALLFGAMLFMEQVLCN